MRVDLTRAAKHHAIAIEDIDLPLSLDVAKDAAGRRTRIVYAVERDPLRRLRTASGLVERHRRVLANVEGFPVEDRLLLRLLDRDLGLAVGYRLRWPLCTEPDIVPSQPRIVRLDRAGIDLHVADDLQAAFGETVGDVVPDLRSSGGCTRGRLCRVQRCTQLRGTLKCLQGLLRHLRGLHRLQTLSLHRARCVSARIGTTSRERTGLSVRLFQQRHGNRCAEQQHADRARNRAFASHDLVLGKRLR